VSISGDLFTYPPPSLLVRIYLKVSSLWFGIETVSDSIHETLTSLCGAGADVAVMEFPHLFKVTCMEYIDNRERNVKN